MTFTASLYVAVCVARTFVRVAWPNMQLFSFFTGWDLSCFFYGATFFFGTLLEFSFFRNFFGISGLFFGRDFFQTFLKHCKKTCFIIQSLGVCNAAQLQTGIAAAKSQRPFSYPPMGRGVEGAYKGGGLTPKFKRVGLSNVFFMFSFFLKNAF